MYQASKPLNIFVVSPRGYEDKLLIVVAEDRKEAFSKAMASPDLLDLARQGNYMQVFDVSKYFGNQGYVVSVVKEGMFH